LSVGFQSSTGRGTSGQQTVMSKGSVKMRRVFRIINNKASGLFVTTMICEYQKDPLRSGMLALVYNSFGC
jgi:ribosomal protein L2